MKKYIIIIVIISLYLIFAIFGTDIIDSINNTYIYIGDNVRWKYSNNKWENIHVDGKFNLKNYKIYNIQTGEMVGKYNLLYDDTWYYKTGNKYSEYQDEMFAYKGNNKFKVIPYEMTEIDNRNIVKSCGITYNYNDISAYQIDIDYDNDGENEKIYVLSNMYSDNDSQFFSVICTYDDNSYITLLKSIVTDSSILAKEQNNIYAIIDLTGDNKYEIITSTAGYSLSTDDVYNLYELNNGKYEKIISNS